MPYTIDELCDELRRIAREIEYAATAADRDTLQLTLYQVSLRVMHYGVTP